MKVTIVVEENGQTQSHCLYESDGQGDSMSAMIHDIPGMGNTQFHLWREAIQRGFDKNLIPVLQSMRDLS